MTQPKGERFILSLRELSGALGDLGTLLPLVALLNGIGYVMIARAYTLQRALDLLVLFVADTLLALLYIAPKLIVTSDITVRTNPLLFVIFIPIIILSVRMLAGMLFGRRGR